jgi:hypothetical protein
MVRITNPEPPAEVDNPETALTASDFAHLHRALLWLLILFAGSAATSLAINLPTPLFAGMQCYLAWCAIATLIQYFFLRIEGSALRRALEISSPPSPSRGIPLPLGRAYWSLVVSF